jgi:HK97 family phage portal protein
MTISGNLFLLKRRNDKGSVVGYEVLDARNVTISADNDFNIIGYSVKFPKRSHSRLYSADDVVHTGIIRDPLDGIFYLSNLEPVRYDVLGDNEANRSNFEWFLSSGIPPAIYKFGTGISEKEMVKIIDGVRNSLQGGKNKHRVIGISGLEGIDQLNQSSDMQHTDRRKYSTEKVCAVLGVPKVQLGYTEGVNYSNATQQYTKFIENTIRPLEAFIKQVFDSLIVADFGGSELEFFINDNHIDDIEQKSRIAQNNLAQGVWTPNEAREYIGYDRLPDELADLLYIPTNRIPLDQVPAGDTPATEPV